MELTYEVTLNYGDREPEPNEPSPTEEDVEEVLAHGLRYRGFVFENVRAVRQ